MPFQLWLLQHNVKCCKNFERFWRRSVKSQALQESVSTNLMHLPGGASDACVLMWEGAQQTRKFKNFKAHTTRSEAQARRLLSEKACEHFWTMLATYRDAGVDL